MSTTGPSFEEKVEMSRTQGDIGAGDTFEIPSPKGTPRVAIIGAGLSGIITSIQLRKRLGLESFTIFERMDSTGGTWRDNTYPGCACDVPAHFYSLSTELNPDWSSKYAGHAELNAYWERIASKHDTVSKTVFSSNFIGGEWIAESHLWLLEFQNTKTGKKFHVEAEVLISAMGGFSKPLDTPPGLPGLENFKGEKFHSARWRHDVKLQGKRVALIGSGCSGCQILPALAKDPSIHILNFSRTPSWFLPRMQFEFTDRQKKVFRYVPGALRFYRTCLWLRSDLFFFVFRTVGFGGRVRTESLEKPLAEYIKSQAPAKYHDFLIPKYPFGCKRLILDGGYLKSFHQENVELITEPIERVSEKGIVGKSGQEYPVDVIVLATGFDVTEHGIGLPLRSKEGKELTDVWTEKQGPQAFLGTSLSGFPNFYTLLGPNVATGHSSAIFSIECQVNYVMRMIEPMVKYGVKSLEVKPEAEEEFNSDLHGKMKRTVWASDACHSYYKIGKKVVVIWPTAVTWYWWRTLRPQFRDYYQEGGDRQLTREKAIGDGLFRLLTILGGTLVAALGVVLSSVISMFLK